MKDCNKKNETQTHAEHAKDSVEIFSTNDVRLKSLGEIFSNESSRKILTLLLEKDMTIMEISKESQISANLIIHHLKKMVDSSIVIVSKESKNKRGHPLRFYRAKPVMVILTKDAASRANASKSLHNVFGKIARFSAIGIAGMFAWIVTNSHSAMESAFKYPRPTLPPYMTPVEPLSGGEFFYSIIVVSGVITVGLAINYIIPRLILKRK